MENSNKLTHKDFISTQRVTQEFCMLHQILDRYRQIDFEFIIQRDSTVIPIIKIPKIKIGIGNQKRFLAYQLFRFDLLNIDNALMEIEELIKLNILGISIVKESIDYNEVKSIPDSSYYEKLDNIDFNILTDKLRKHFLILTRNHTPFTNTSPFFAEALINGFFQNRIEWLKELKENLLSYKNNKSLFHKSIHLSLRQIALLCQYEKIPVTDAIAGRILECFEQNSGKKLVAHYRRLNTPNQRTASNIQTANDIKTVIPLLVSPEAKELANKELLMASENQRKSKQD